MWIQSQPKVSLVFLKNKTQLLLLLEEPPMLLIGSPILTSEELIFIYID